jgi:hypothetical protein
MKVDLSLFLVLICTMRGLLPNPQWTALWDKVAPILSEQKSG